MLDRILMLAGLSCLLGILLTGPPIANGNQEQDDASAHIKKLESCIGPVNLAGGNPTQCQSLKDRMAENRVPALSIAVVHKGVIEWAKGYGVEQLGGAPVDANTLFQAGSISKPVAALGVLRLVQQGKLSLDSDANGELDTWKIPSSPAAGGGVVTLRELLTHTAGMTVHGFPGYPKNAPVPTLREVLDGMPPANTPPIRIESVPGSEWNYSGGGFTVIQQMVIDATRQPFPKVMKDTVLQPIGMIHSTYQQPLPLDLLPSAAKPYLANGDPVAGGPHTYPEMAAAGLWTTPTDLARYIIEVQRSLQGEANHVLSRDMTQQMLIAGKGNWGLGVQIGGSDSAPYFTHGGSNAGYEALFVGYENLGEGAVVMTNAQGGARLAGQVMSSIASIYHWPYFRVGLMRRKLIRVPSH